MGKAKLTLTVDKKVIREAKVESAKRNVSISQMVEALLKSMSPSWLDVLMQSLGVKSEYFSYDEIVKNRPKGRDSGKAVREMRYGREKRISGH
ncbi:MAG: DUF6364 family protein [Candidatus Micrarchaeales archaeon]